MKGHVCLTLHRFAALPHPHAITQRTRQTLQICGDFMLYESNDAPSIQLVTRQTVTVKGRMASGPLGRIVTCSSIPRPRPGKVSWAHRRWMTFLDLRQGYLKKRSAEPNIRDHRASFPSEVQIFLPWDCSFWQSRPCSCFRLARINISINNTVSTTALYFPDYYLL